MPTGLSTVSGTPAASASSFRVFVKTASKRFGTPARSPLKITPLLAPVSVRGGGVDDVDVGLLDLMTTDEFLAVLKSRTDSNGAALWRAACTLTTQLKGSRALLSFGGYLTSNNGVGKAFDRLLDTAHFVLNAEHVFLMQLDADGAHLVVTHCRADAAVGVRVPVAQGECWQIALVVCDWT